MNPLSNLRNYKLYLEICKPEIHEPQCQMIWSGIDQSRLSIFKPSITDDIDQLLDIIKEQRKKIKELETMINYMPDGPGYESAKKSFESMIEKNKVQ